MTDLKKAAQQALEALEARAVNRYFEHLGETIAALKAALEQPEQEPFGYIWPTGRHPEFRYTQQMRDGVAGMPLYTHPPETEPAFDALVAISLLTHLGGEVADYEDVVEAVRRVHALNGELGAALRRLISYCNTLENRLMEADGEHPAMQEAKEAYAKAEGKV
jgi:HPt (histidine-containing phosphotransfer) domain-containing protein